MEWREKGGRREAARGQLSPTAAERGQAACRRPEAALGETAKTLDLDLKSGIFSEMQMKITSI